MLRSLVAILAILIISITGCKSTDATGSDASGGSEAASSGSVVGEPGEFEKADSLDVGDCFLMVLRVGAVKVDCDASNEYNDPEDGHPVLSVVSRVTEILEHEFDYESTDTTTLCENPEDGILPGSEIGRDDLTFCADRLPTSAELAYG